MLNDLKRSEPLMSIDEMYNLAHMLDSHLKSCKKSWESYLNNSEWFIRILIMRSVSFVILKRSMKIKYHQKIK